MKNITLDKDRLYQRVYDYSRKSLSFKHKFAVLLIKLSLNSIFGILIYLFIVLLKGYPDNTLLLYILGAVLMSFLIELNWENGEIKKLRKQEMVQSRTLTSLFNDYKLASRNIRARDEFLSIVSHELKTPLSVMLLKLHSELENIRSSSLANFSVHELIAVIKNSEQQIKRLKLMIDDLHDVSLITTGRMDLQLENIDLVAVTKQVVQSFSEMLKKEKSRLKIKTKAAVLGKWDKARIEQAITNLVSNAIKYGEGKSIEILIFKKGANASFIIKDSGIGISAEEQKFIFDLFKRAPRAREYKKGLGVGLFITSQIVKMHGGKIKVSSAPAKGTTFSIELPR